MQQNIIEITLFSLLCCILIFVTIITIINYTDFNNQFYTVYIQAEPSNNNNNENEEEIEKDNINNKEDKEEKEEEKKKKKDSKKEENKREIKKYQKKDDNDSWTNADQDLITKYNYRNLAIPKVYQTAPAH